MVASTRPRRSPSRDVEIGLAVARPLDLDVLAEVGERLLEVGDAQRHVLERATLAGPFLGEERQLAAARVGPDEGERVGAIDDVHADSSGDEVRDAVAVGDPEGDVVEGLRLHGQEHSCGGGGRAERPDPPRGLGEPGGSPSCPHSSYFRRSTARWSWALFIFERPEMFIRFASL